MSKNKKRPQQNPPVEHKDGQREKENTNRHVYIEPGAKIDFIEDLKQKYDAHQQEGTTYNNKILFWTKVSAFLFFVYATLTFFQVEFAKKAWDAAEKGLQANVEALRVDQRAWVSLLFPVETKDHQPLKANTPFSLKLIFKNTGKTPALRISYDPIIAIHPVTETFADYDKERIGPTLYDRLGIHEAALIPPGEEIPIYFPAILVNAPPAVLPQPIFDSIINHRQILFIVGQVTYHDIFPDTPERHTTFCIYYVPEGGEGQGGFPFCPINRLMD